jgi:pimeloyl-ACP methyl ester carboxylesterase
VRLVSALAAIAGLVLLTLGVVHLTRGGGGHPVAARETVLGRGAGRVWLFRPPGTPKDAVVFVHGLGGPTEDTPHYHLAWIHHLVDEGNAVIYPRYEVDPGPAPVPHIVRGVRTALARLGGDPRTAVIGYSRGGRLAVEYAAVSARNGLPAPKAVMSVFPSARAVDQTISLQSLDRGTRLDLLVGEADSIGRLGALELLSRLRRAGFPAEHVQAWVVRSKRGFTADHFSALRDTPQARAAFWDPADRMIDSIR